MGTPEFAVPTLERLLDSRHEVKLVITQPSRPKGRGMKVADPPVKVLADSRGIPVLQPSKLIKEGIAEKIRETGADVGVVVAYGRILPESVIESTRLGWLNVHASLLPEYRGAAPIQRALMDGRLETGVTIMKLVAELDSGPIISQQSMEIHEDDDALSVANYLSVLGADLLMRALDEIERDGVIEGEEQNHEQATYAPMITKEEGTIDWNEPSVQIMFKLRGLTPWPGLFTSLSGKRLRIIQAEPLDEEEAEHVGATNELKPGTVSGIMKGFGFVVKTGDGHLLIHNLQLEGKTPVDGDAFLNGFPMKVGQKLG